MTCCPFGSNLGGRQGCSAKEKKPVKSWHRAQMPRVPTFFPTESAFLATDRPFSHAGARSQTDQALPIGRGAL